MESFDGLERRGDLVLLSANSGSLSVVFSEEAWKEATGGRASLQQPTPEELTELRRIRDGLEEHAEENAFRTVLRDVRCAGERSALSYDLVLEPAGLLAAMTGYLFAPVVDAGMVGRVGSSLGDGTVEQAYLVGAVADEDALAAGDDGLRVLSVRGRRCSASRFEMPPELWQVLSKKLGWSDVETFVNREA